MNKSIWIEELDQEFDLKTITESIYYYRYECYSGSGVLIAPYRDKWDLTYLWHCSCYWPLEGFFEKYKRGQYTKKEVLLLIDNIELDDLGYYDNEVNIEIIRNDFKDYVNNY